MLLTYFATAVLVALLCLKYFFYSSPKSQRIPGPSLFSVFGNSHSLGCRPQQKLKDLAQQYGELFQLQQHGQRWVFVNSIEAVRSIFDKQASSTASKKPMPVVSDLISGSMRFFLMPKGYKWRILRTIIQAQLTPRRSDLYQPDQDGEARQLMHDILTDNEHQKKFYTHVRRYTMSMMMRITYGTSISTSDDNQMHEIYEILQDFSEATLARGYLADAFPILSLLPPWLQWWRKPALALQQRQKNAWMKYWAGLEARMQEKNSKECLAKRWLEIDQKRHNTLHISRNQWAFFAGTMIEAGSESQSAALNDCLKHLAANPQVQSRAHEELCGVVGSARSPTVSDRPKCPYTRACIKEILRLVPSTSNGFAHYTTDDVFYKDYHIPKNTLLSINIWALSHDESRYKEATKFRPERYFDQNENLHLGRNGRIDPYGPERYIWGAGRRICPGIYVADNGLFIALAKILWAFEIRPPLDEMGRESMLDLSEESYEEGRISIPRPFGLRFLSRGRVYEDMIAKEWKECSALEAGLH